MKQRIEQFWTEAESLLNSDKKLIDKISEIENLIRERLERFELINYDAEFNLVKESGIENLANQQKEKIIKNIWNPLFNEASTFQEYSYLLNWVIPVNKWYSFCGDYELTDKTYDVLAEVIDKNASLDDIIFILRSEESYNVSEKKPEAFKILAEYFMKNGDADELSGYLDPDDQHFETIRYFPYQILLQLLNKVKNAFEETDWQRILDLLEIDAEDIEGSIKNLEKKDDPVSLKEESDKTPKTGKQISTDDQVADSATVKTENHDELEIDLENGEVQDQDIDFSALVASGDIDNYLTVSNNNMCPSEILTTIYMDEELPWGSAKCEELTIAILKNPNCPIYFMKLYFNLGEHLDIILNHPNCPDDIEKQSTTNEKENQVTDSATVKTENQEFTIKRFKDNSIKVFQKGGTPMSGSVKAFLLSIIKQDELDVEIEKKNTRTIGKKVIEALNSK